MNRLHAKIVVSVVAATAFISSVMAQVNIPSDGSDGAFNPTESMTIDLSLAPTGAWNTPGTGGGVNATGVYDPDQWAVVFKFSEINIPGGVTITFKNHPSYAPVMWLVDGDVVINGTVSLNGATGHAHNVFPRVQAEPGPGGFRGGIGSSDFQVGSSGYGPGGGQMGSSSSGGAGGSHATLGSTAMGNTGAVGPVYGNEGAYSLIGGSGGAGGNGGSGASGGGGGGGAVLIASSQTIHIGGSITANGGNGPGGNWSGARRGGGGSGGTIRLIADFVGGTGVLEARNGFGGTGGTGPTSGCSGCLNGGNGGAGRIRVEGNTIELAGSSNPDYSAGFAGSEPRIFRDAETPIVRGVTLGGVPVPLDPEPTFSFPTDVIVDESGNALLVIEGENIPADGSVQVRITRRVGATSIFNAQFQTMNGFLSIWQAEVNLASGFSGIQIRAALPDEG